MAKMTLTDNFAPDKGVTMLENADDGKKIQNEAQPNFQVFKKGKPFTKMASNDVTPRMTREGYFKIADT